MEQSISSISLSSRIASRIQPPSKQPASTNPDSLLSSLLSLDSSSNPSHLHPHPSPKLLQLQTRARQYEKKMADLQNIFGKAIQSLQQEIARKEELNLRLEAEVKVVSRELEEGKKDMSIIIRYLQQQNEIAAENDARHRLINSNKITHKLDKSISGSKQSIDLSAGSLRIERKNRSPKLLHQKTFKE